MTATDLLDRVEKLLDELLDPECLCFVCTEHSTAVDAWKRDRAALRDMDRSKRTNEFSALSEAERGIGQ